MTSGGVPPGMHGRLEYTPGEKGNRPGQFDPLPGQGKRGERAQSGWQRLLAKLHLRRG